ncbi:MAG TPA: hypothetical protein VFV50_00105, partial [Bdellovibrionales bacterium]|nr:hypothetical protein [Bdellovibrionales bacterium]
ETSGNMVFAGLGANLYVSTDNGATFALRRQGVPGDFNDWPKKIVYDGTRLFVLTNNALHISTDLGLTFTARGAAQGLTGTNFTKVKVSGNNIAVIDTNTGLRISTNGGATFQTVDLTGTIGYNPSGYDVLFEGATIVYGTGIGLFVSNNTGASFTQVPNTIAIDLVQRVGSSILVGNWSGLSVLAANMASLSPISTAVTPGGLIWRVISAGSRLYAGSSEGFFYSSNNGDTWTRINVGGGVAPWFGTNAIDATDALIAVGFGDPTGRVGLAISNNAGASYALRDLSSYPRSVAIDGNRIVVGTNNEVCISPNAGGTFTCATAINGLGDSFYGAVLASGSRVFVASSGGRFFRSNDNGATYSEVVLAADIRVKSFSRAGAKIYVSTSRGAFVSIDGGATFQKAFDNPSLSYAEWDILEIGSRVFLGGNYVSLIDNATSPAGVREFKLSANGLASILTRSLARHGGYIFVGTEAGLGRIREDQL